jgi:hypothetical protein
MKERPVMDGHIRILALAARATERRLERHDAAGHSSSAGPDRRGELARRVTVSRARLAEARARRRSTALS